MGASLELRLANACNETWHRTDFDLTSGDWGDDGKAMPPDTIGPHEIRRWVNSSSFSTTDLAGRIEFADNHGRRLGIEWKKPFMGDTEVTAEASAGLTVCRSISKESDDQTALVMVGRLRER